MKLPLILSLILLFPAALFAVELTVDINGLRNDEGHVILGVYPDKETFKNPRGATHYHTGIRITNGTASVSFDLAPGTYAVALFHDENDNEDLDMTQVVSIPKEGFGFSKDATLSPGWPDFEDAVFELGEKPLTLTITMQYSVVESIKNSIPLEKLNILPKLPKLPFKSPWN